jgi:CDP-glucose 4,6-dehydratase
MFDSFYSGKRVFVTGHTGFKGSWLSLWLKRLGARVAGYAMPAPTNPNLHTLFHRSVFAEEFIADIRDIPQLQRALASFEPEVIFHLAAQPLVRLSYEQPVETFTTNAVGTLNLLEAVRTLKMPSALVLITTDKCYENKEWNYSYRENDSLGGHDPYSASKAAAELIIHSWRESFFKPSPQLGPVASARAGNVIGGGDYAQDRIVPDAIRALLSGSELTVRNPSATRPWQHVLDSIHGYLMLGQRLATNQPGSEFASGFNFGPGPEGNYPVRSIVEHMFKIMPGKWNSPPQNGQPHEASKLNLAIDKAVSLLGWKPTWSFAEALDKTVAWYNERHFLHNKDMLEFSLGQIEEFERSTQSR